MRIKKQDKNELLLLKFYTDSASRFYPDIQIYLDKIRILAHGQGSSEWTSNVAEALDM